MYKVVHCIAVYNCNLYTLYTTGIRHKQAGTRRVGCIACIGWFRALLRIEVLSGFLCRLLYSATGRSRTGWHVESPAFHCGLQWFQRFQTPHSGPLVPNASLKPEPISWRPSRPPGVLCTLNVETRSLYSTLYSETAAVCIRYTSDSHCHGLLVSYTAYTAIQRIHDTAYTVHIVISYDASWCMPSRRASLGIIGRWE